MNKEELLLLLLTIITVGIITNYVIEDLFVDKKSIRKIEQIQF